MHAHTRTHTWNEVTGCLDVLGPALVCSRACLLELHLLLLRKVTHARTRILARTQAHSADGKKDQRTDRRTDRPADRPKDRHGRMLVLPCLHAQVGSIWSTDCQVYTEVEHLATVTNS